MQTIPAEINPANVVLTYATLYDNVLFDIEMPRGFKPIHAYCMKRLKIKGWHIQKLDIAKQFNISLSTVTRALRWFRDHGYALYDKVKGWQVFPSAQTIAQATVNEALEPMAGGSFLTTEEPIKEINFDPLIERKAFTEIETTTQPHEPEPVIPVVVCLEEEKISPLVFPSELSEPQLNAAKHRIKLAPIDMQQAILIVLAANLAKGTVKNPIGYLNTLITAANNGTFTTVGSVTATNQGGKPLIPIWRGFKASTPSEPDKAKGFIQQAKQALRGMAIHE
jgi:hypothetical protein